MAETDIDSTTVTDVSSTLVDYSVPTEVTDGATESKETEWTNQEWTKYFGYYKTIPERLARLGIRR